MKIVKRTTIFYTILLNKNKFIKKNTLSHNYFKKILSLVDQTLALSQGLSELISQSLPFKIET